MKNLLLIILLFVGCGTDRLQYLCTHECYTGPKGTMNIGQCKSGLTVCDEKRNEQRDDSGEIICEGEVLPEDELCDNVDNDCDGLVDGMRVSAISSFLPFGLNGYPCLTFGECSDSAAICRSGDWKCSYSSGVELPQEKSCDGLDNDCDGQIDDGIYSDIPVSNRVCYSGNPVETLAIPPCRAGLLDCVNGENVCLNEKIPSIELCDEVDNDCNGVIDDTGDTLTSRYDLVFIVDTSGSMCGEIAAVATALNAYAAQFDGNPNFKFALVIMSEFDGARVQVDTDFTDFSNIRNRLLYLGCYGGSEEASMDSAQQVCDKQNNPLGLSWRSSANSLFFMFTDEAQQSYTTPYTTGQDVIDTCVLNNVLPFMWALYEWDFRYIAEGANGGYFTLVDDWQIIFDNLNSIIITLCQ